VSRAVWFADAARWQLRSAVEAVARRDAEEAATFLESVRCLVRDGDRLEAEGTPLSDFPDLPQREVRAGVHRVFFRYVDEDLWITGVWKAQPT